MTVATDLALQRALEEGHRWGLEQDMAEFEPFARLVAEKPPRHVVEIGVRRGGTAAVWHTLSSGLVVGVDLPDEFAWARSKVLEAEYPRYHSVLSDSHLVSAVNVVADLLLSDPPATGVDLLFIDGDHSLAGVTADFAMYSPLVRPGGLIAFHDIVDSQFCRDTDTRVCEFWDRLEGNKVEFNEHGQWGGIGVLIT